MQSSKKAVLLFLAVFMVSGCAEKWQKPGATELDFEVMKTACVNRSLMRFPPMMRQVLVEDAHHTPVTTRCKTSPSTVTCTTHGGDFVPPKYAAVDDNDTARDQDRRQCFLENGWVPVQD